MQNPVHVIFFTILILFFNSLVAQNVRQQDVIYLSDGSIYRGTITEQYPDSIIKIEIIGSNIIVIKASSVNRITKENTLSDYYMPVVIKQKGYYNITNLGLLSGTGTYDEVVIGPTLETINGYQFNPHLQTGIAVAADYMMHGMLNICADVRWNFLESRVTPFVYADAGINIPIHVEEENEFTVITSQTGFALASGVGLRINGRSGLAFVMGVGYKMNSYTLVYDYLFSETHTENKYTYNRLAFKIGFAF